MELPQPRPFEAEGRKPTHDFLSLYSHSTAQQDPRPPPQGGYLKTHDFLQPLERVARTKEETGSIDLSVSEKPPPQAQPPPPPPVDQQHFLPGGVGTYSISHISCLSRVPKAEGTTMFSVAQASSNERNTDENSNCSSYTGSGFTLWEESTAKKGQTRKENAVERPVLRGEAAVKMGPWAVSDRPSHSSTNNHRHSFSSLSSSQASGQKSQSFMEMIKSAKGSSQDDDLDDEDEFFVKKENSSTTQKADLRVRVDAKNSGADQKPDTPRSKHSATEQRRRSKINDRFQMLRQLIPNSDQKRDKASFLLEVIEYVQFLQEKVNKYEGSYPGWNHEPGKLMKWGNNECPTEAYVDQARGMDRGSAPPVVFAPKFESRSISMSQTIPASVHNNAEEPDMSALGTMRVLDQRAGRANRAVPFPVSFQPNHFFPPVISGSPSAEAPRLASDAENNLSGPQAQSRLVHSHSIDGPVVSDKLQEQGLDIEGGNISISSVYSQGLLNTLTQALRSSGVDMSQANISVQIELGKRARDRLTMAAPTIKDKGISPGTQSSKRSRTMEGEGIDQATSKRLKTGRS